MSEKNIELFKPVNVPRIALRPAEAAQAIGVSEATLQRWAKDGRVKSVKIENVTLYSVEALKGLVNQ